MFVRCFHIWVWSLFLLCVALPPALGMHNHAKGVISTSSPYYILSSYGFGYQSGGSMSFYIENDSKRYSPLYFFLLDYDSLLNVEEDYSSDDDSGRICKYINNNWERNRRFDAACAEIIEPKNARQIDHALEHSGRYFITLVYCNASDTTANVWWTDENPHGNFLDSGQIPLPYIYSIFALFMLIVFIFWMVNWAMHFRTKILLQRLLTIVPVAACISLIFFATDYFYRSRIGYESWVIYGFRVIASLFFQLSFFFCVMLIAKGLSITRPKLETSDKRTMTILLVGLAFGWLIYSLLLSFFVFFYFVVLMAFLWIVFTSVARNMLAIRGQLILIRDAGINPLTTPVIRKYFIFRRFQAIVFSCVGFLILVEIISLIFFFYIPWIQELLEWLTYFFAFCLIGWTFRLRSFSAVFANPPPMGGDHSPHVINSPVPNAPPGGDDEEVEDNSATMMGHDVEAPDARLLLAEIDDAAGGIQPPFRAARIHAGDLEGTDGLRAWEEGMAIPSLPMHVFRPHHKNRHRSSRKNGSRTDVNRVVVVENPAEAGLSLGAPMDPAGTMVVMDEEEMSEELVEYIPDEEVAAYGSQQPNQNQIDDSYIRDVQSGNRVEEVEVDEEERNAYG